MGKATQVGSRQGPGGPLAWQGRNCGGSAPQVGLTGTGDVSGGGRAGRGAVLGRQTEDAGGILKGGLALGDKWCPHSGG